MAHFNRGPTSGPHGRARIGVIAALLTVGPTGAPLYATGVNGARADFVDPIQESQFASGNWIAEDLTNAAASFHSDVPVEGGWSPGLGIPRGERAARPPFAEAIWKAANAASFTAFGHKCVLSEFALGRGRVRAGVTVVFGP